MKNFLHITAALLFGAAVSVIEAQNVTSPKLAKARAKVWAQYVKAWKQTDNIDAFSFKPLAEAEHGSWVLPDTLEKNATLDYYTGTKGERPSNGYPFYLYLHGSGPRDLEWKTGLALTQDFDDAPSMYMVPRIPNEGELYRWWHRSKQWAWEHMLRRILSNPNIDASRIYWFGISEGGYGSQRLASFYADYLAAAGPMAGGEPLRNAPAENLSHTPLSFITGEYDGMFYRNILTPRTGERLDSLQRIYPDEYVHRIIIEKNHGHGVSYQLTTPWLKQFSRTAQPRHFRWENFEMDGRKRNAFYNIEVLSESSEHRHDYEFSVNDNTVNLTVREVEYIITERDPYYGIELNNTRQYTDARHGAIRIYLSEELIDMSRPVILNINGHLTSTVKPTVSKETMRKSCELFGDPMRIFPFVIEAEW